MSVLNKLTEGIVSRDLRQEGDALLSKWEKTGLLEGLEADSTRQGMARLLENQAAQLLKEASSMSGGNVEGFASVAFPLVRRVFGGLLANDVVSVQPMSLPSGLIFFLDFTHNSTRGHGRAGESVFGGNAVGQQITGGIRLGYDGGAEMGQPSGSNDLSKGFYNLGNGYSSPTGAVDLVPAKLLVYDPIDQAGEATLELGTAFSASEVGKVLRFDADLQALGDGYEVIIGKAALSDIENVSSSGRYLNKRNTVGINATFNQAAENEVQLVRRLTTLGGNVHRTSNAWDGLETHVYFVFVGTDADVAGLHDHTHGQELMDTAAEDNTLTVTFPLADNFGGTATADDGVNNAVGVVAAASEWGLEDEAFIPEIDIKVDSIAVTAVTKKLKAKWTPELGQDLNAYHNLDAEVELTSILSEQIALEIDREILNDLITGATAGTIYWSRSPGLFVNRETGVEIGASSAAPDFTGTVSEWYETLIEAINDVSARIHRKTLRGGANFVICSPEVASILEFTAGFRASVTVDSDTGSIGAVKTGAISKKFDVYVDPYFPRNVILVGRKGGSFLESGYVYAPYVPLQVTPTIFGVEDFVPRKGVMTRYAKKMVRSDMYGLVICRGLTGEAGATA